MLTQLFFCPRIPLPTEENPLIFYSNQARHDLHKTYINFLNTSKKSIYIRVYGLRDQEILSTLSKKAIDGARVTVAYDRGGSGASPGSLAEKIHKFPINAKGLMHQKICIQDEKSCLIGTANLTTPSLKMHDNLVLGIYSPQLCKELYSGMQKQSRFQIGSQELELRILPDPSGESELKVERLIDGAKKSIYVAMFTLTHAPITDHLIQAKNRGIDVHVAIDGYTARGASQSAIEKLENAGIKVTRGKGIQLLHHKWALIDNTTLIMGSANWTKAAFNQNDDLIMIIHNLTKKQRNVMNQVWNRLSKKAFIH